MDSITPNIFVKDINKTITFYQQLGFKIAIKVPEEGEPVFVMMTCGKVSFMFQTLDSLGTELPEISRKPGGSLLLYIKKPKVRKFHDQIKGWTNVLKGLEKTFYGATEFSILDPNGYVLTFTEDEA